MKQFNMAIAIVILISSIVLISINLFNSQQIQIILETGQEVTTNSNYFTLTKVLILIFCSFLSGAAIAYLYYGSNGDEASFSIRKKQFKEASERKETQEKTDLKKYEIVTSLLKPDERKAVLALKENAGEMLQNKLALKLGFSKVKMARVLISLESKNIITKERFGLTNKIKFVK